MKDLLEVWIISIGFWEILNFPRSCCVTLSQSRRCLLSLMLRCLAWVTPPRLTGHVSWYNDWDSQSLVRIESLLFYLLSFRVSCYNILSLLYCLRVSSCYVPKARDIIYKVSCITAEPPAEVQVAHYHNAINRDESGPWTLVATI